MPYTSKRHTKVPAILLVGLGFRLLAGLIFSLVLAHRTIGVEGDDTICANLILFPSPHTSLTPPCAAYQDALVLVAPTRLVLWILDALAAMDGYRESDTSAAGPPGGALPPNFLGPVAAGCPTLTH
jgi:hypothetical protein